MPSPDTKNNSKHKRSKSKRRLIALNQALSVENRKLREQLDHNITSLKHLEEKRVEAAKLETEHKDAIKDLACAKVELCTWKTNMEVMVFCRQRRWRRICKERFTNRNCT